MAARQASRSIALVLTAAAGLGGYAWAADTALADGGRTRYRIVIAKTADVSTEAVAADFARILKEITGADFEVVTDETEPSEHEIIMGAGAMSGQPKPQIKTVSILGLVAAVLCGNVVGIVLEILALVNLSKPEVDSWLQSQQR